VTTPLGDAIDAALAARSRLVGRSARETATALAEAARRCVRDPDLLRDLPDAADLSPAMVRTVLPLAAEALDADAMVALHGRESREGTPPALVAAVLASNVPALALPAIAHACLAGAALVVKSGRADMVSAPAFQRALATVDPVLAATVVPVYWHGGTRDVEDAVLSRADVIVATGADSTMAELASRRGTTVVTHGDRTSIAVVMDDATDDELRALAWDVARYEQRGCLSPHAVFVKGDPLRLAPRLCAALDVVGDAVPPPTSLAARAARRMALEEARFAGAVVHEGPGGAVVVGAGPPIGGRTIRLRAFGASDMPAFDAGTVECVGVGHGVQLDVDALRLLGVARVCPLGRMQRPRIDWPRGQRPPLATLFRAAGEPRIQVES
jgi:hypothetical protein